MWWGYVSSLVRQAPRYDEPGFRAFLRRYQWDCLWRGKATATRHLDDRQAAAWRHHERVVAP
jgi:hypothetical protein